MTPIVSQDDIRLNTLIGVALEVIEELALVTDVNPEQILSDKLYLVTKQIQEQDPNLNMNKLCTNYPMLSEAIR